MGERSRSVSLSSDSENGDVLSNMQQVDERSNSIFVSEDSEELDSSSASDSSTASITTENALFEDYNVPVHPELSCTKLSVLEMILIFFLRHNLTQVALEDLLILVNSILGIKSLPVSKYFFFKLFSKQYNPKKKFFCKKCKSLFDYNPDSINELNHQLECQNAKCKVVNYPTTSDSENYFITFPLAYQLKETILQNIKDFSIGDENRSDDFVTDIQDGIIYKMKPNVGRHEITLTLNTDGVQVFNSKSISLWPVQLIINNLKKECRFITKNIIVTGLYFRSKHPSMESLLKPLVDEIKTICENGFNLTIGNIF